MLAQLARPPTWETRCKSHLPSSVDMRIRLPRHEILFLAVYEHKTLAAMLSFRLEEKLSVDRATRPLDIRDRIWRAA
jgi:hypothetical protein